MTDDARLLEALAVIQARGPIGERSLADAVAHAERFVELIPSGPRTVVDLGSGGGLPALVIAWRRPDLTVTMIERRHSRADLLRRAISALALTDRAGVAAIDVQQLAKTNGGSFDVVTARSFGDPRATATALDALLGPGGLGLVSEPPSDRSEAWAAALNRHPNLVDEGVHEGIRRLRCRRRST